MFHTVAIFHSEVKMKQFSNVVSPLIWELDLWLIGGLDVARPIWGHFMTKSTKRQRILHYVEKFDNSLSVA